jgi:hypothetical protein
MQLQHRTGVVSGPAIRRRPRRRVLAVAAVATAALVSMLLVRAFAAGLFVSTDQITAQNLEGLSGAPTVYGSDNFDRVQNPLQGTVSPGGLLWKPQIGTWLTNGTTARTSTSNAKANVLMDLPTVDASMVVTISPGTGTARPGVTFNDDGNDNMLLLYSASGGGTLTLSTYFGPTRVFVASTNGVGNPNSAFELRVTSIGPTITVYVNGTLRMTQTLTGANLCKFKDTGPGCVSDGQPNVGFGLWADSDTQSTFDNFRVESV